MGASAALAAQVETARAAAMAELLAAQTQLATLEADLASRLANPQPNYTISGTTGAQTFAHGDLLKTLQSGIDTWVKKIAALQKLIEDQTTMLGKLQPFQFISATTANPARR